MLYCTKLHRINIELYFIVLHRVVKHTLMSSACLRAQSLRVRVPPEKLQRVNTDLILHLAPIIIVHCCDIFSASHLIFFVLIFRQICADNEVWTRCLPVSLSSVSHVHSSRHELLHHIIQYPSKSSSVLRNPTWLKSALAGNLPPSILDKCPNPLYIGAI